jgi:hypothetical protein
MSIFYLILIGSSYNAIASAYSPWKSMPFSMFRSCLIKHDLIYLLDFVKLSIPSKWSNIKTNSVCQNYENILFRKSVYRKLFHNFKNTSDIFVWRKWEWIFTFYSVLYHVFVFVSEISINKPKKLLWQGWV